MVFSLIAILCFFVFVFVFVAHNNAQNPKPQHERLALSSTATSPLQGLCLARGRQSFACALFAPISKRNEAGLQCFFFHIISCWVLPASYTVTETSLRPFDLSPSLLSSAGKLHLVVAVVVVSVV